MRSIKPIRKGEEIFNDYGELPRADLLRRYGYVTDNYAQYDEVEISMRTICYAAGIPSAIPGPEHPCVCLRSTELCILKYMTDSAVAGILRKYGSVRRWLQHSSTQPQYTTHGSAP